MVIRLTVLGVVLASLFFTAGGVEKQGAVAVRAEPVGSTQTYRVDPVHSTVVFRIKHQKVAYFYGRFNEISGEIAWDEENPEAGSLDITINAASVDTANERRDAHLRSDDFFSAEQYPAIRFRTTSIERNGEKYKAKGELTLRGVTREIAVDIEHTGTNTTGRGVQLIGFHSVFTINRTEFNMPYGVEAGALGDEVVLMIGIEGIKR